MTPVPVLYVTHTAAVSGAEMSLAALIRGLDRRRFRPLVVVPSEGRLPELLRREGVPAEVLPLERGGLRRPDQIARNLARLGRLGRRHGVRLLHANSFHAIRMSLPYARLRRLPLLGSIRDMLPFSPLTVRVILGCDRVLCVSRAARDHLAARSPAGRRHRLEVVHNGVDADRLLSPLDRREAAAAVGLEAAGEPRIGVIAPLVRWKGQDLFLEAAARVRRRLAAACFVIAGDETFAEPGYVGGLRRRAAAEDLEGAVLFLGFCDRVPELLAALDLVVCPSRLPDPLPRAVLEAMAAGRPVVAAAHGGIPEAVVEGETGLLVAPGDADALAEAMLDLLGDGARRRRMGRRAAALARRRFSLAAHCERVMAIYDELLASRRPPG